MPRNVAVNFVRITRVTIDQQLNGDTGAVVAEYLVGSHAEAGYQDMRDLTQRGTVNITVQNDSTATQIWGQLVGAIQAQEGLDLAAGDQFFPVPA